MGGGIEQSINLLQYSSYWYSGTCYLDVHKLKRPDIWSLDS